MLFQDFNCNRNNIKGQIIMFAFRISNLATINKFMFFVMIPYLIFYRVFVEWFLCVEIPYKTKIGKNFKLFHGQALVINDGTIIGDSCTFRHSTTIGHRKLENGLFSSSPVIGNNVDVGSNVCIIGPIKIGNNVKIGAGSVVVKDVPSNSVVVGNPGRVIKSIV